MSILDLILCVAVLALLLSLPAAVLVMVMVTKDIWEIWKEDRND